MQTTPPTDGLWKFVRVNGEYRFSEVFMGGKNHSDLVQKGETAESAGTVSVYSDRWSMFEYYSQTLKVGVDKDDEVNLCNLLNKPMM